MSDETSSPPQIKIAWLIGTLAAFALFALIGAYSSSKTWHYTGFEEQRAADRVTTLAKLQQDEHALINPVDDKGNPTAQWIDQDKGIIRIPIDQAMAKEIDALKSASPQAGCEIAGVPAATPAPTNAAPSAVVPPATNAATATPPAKKKK